MAPDHDPLTPLPVVRPERRVAPRDDGVIADADAGAEVEPVPRRDERPRAQFEVRLDRVDEILVDDRIDRILAEDGTIAPDFDPPSAPEEIEKPDMGVVADLQVADLKEEIEGANADAVADLASLYA